MQSIIPSEKNSRVTYAWQQNSEDVSCTCERKVRRESNEPVFFVIFKLKTQYTRK